MSWLINQWLAALLAPTDPAAALSRGHAALAGPADVRMPAVLAWQAAALLRMWWPR